MIQLCRTAIETRRYHQIGLAATKKSRNWTRINITKRTVQRTAIFMLVAENRLNAQNFTESQDGFSSVFQVANIEAIKMASCCVNVAPQAKNGDVDGQTSRPLLRPFPF